jgi:hypothetical protein
MRRVSFSEALQRLVPEAQWEMLHGEYEGLTWKSSDIPVPTKQEILDAQARYQKEEDDKEYMFKRMAEYPDFKEYLDGIVKNDQLQVDNYISKCLAVKAKYPKPQQGE